MVRSMFSGVAGMKAHQTKMDVIGNNIANVNTFGFKSSRVTFRDVYYQSMRSASTGTGTKGGTNPSQIGYGSVLGSVDVNQGTSTMQNTGNPLDVAISGEGFFQVQDTDGNVFYTKAGMFDIDSFGNLVDVNGNFILGVSGNPIGKPAGNDRIQLNVPSVNAASATSKMNINSAEIKIEAKNKTTDGNVSFNFTDGSDLPVGQPVKAIITSGGITIRVNPKESFASDAAFSQAVNAAITEANAGKPHPAGDFTITVDPASKFTGGLTGEEIIGSNFGVKKGSVDVPNAWEKIFTIDSVGDKFSGGLAGTPAAYTVTKDAAPVPPAEQTYNFQIVSNGKTYSGKLTEKQMESSTSLILEQNPKVPGDTITMTVPTLTSMLSTLQAGLGTPPVPNADGPWTTNAELDSTSSTPSKDLGLGGNTIKLGGGTAGGTQSVEDLTGIAIGSDGVIVANHAVHGLMELGRIDLATFANPKGLQQQGNTYYSATGNSGAAVNAKAGEGGTGALASGSLEMSNVDLSNEFADMITTQRGFQANSRMITVSDTMLEELINLKR